MDIRIIHDGVEIGPFPEETVQTLLRQGNVTITDLAWRTGLPQWVPLANLLYATNTPPPPPGSLPPPPPPPAPVAVSSASVEEVVPEFPQEPATAKQKAFLNFMGIAFASEIDREEASHLVNEAMENPKDGPRLARWNRERLRLHPELFAEEIQAAREQRAQHFHEVCETEGEPYFNKVTKAHCQVLVQYLDVHHPQWDSDQREAATSYFFPAIAEKFPQLVKKEAKGKFKYPEGPKVAREIVHRSPVAVKAKKTSPAAALARGVFFGVLILGVMWFVKNLLDSKGAQKTIAATNPAATPAIASSSSESNSAMTPGETSVGTTPPAEGPAAPETTNTGAPGEMNTGTTPAATADTTNTAMIPATDSSTPASADSSNSFAPQPPPPAPPGTLLVLTKPADVQGAFGKMKLPVGTRLKLLQQNGPMLTVQYAGKDVATIPASSTNLGSDLMPAMAPGLPPPAVAPPIAAPPVPAATPAPAPASTDSLFGPPKSGTAGTTPMSDL